MDNISVGDYAEQLLAHQGKVPVDHTLKPTPSHLPHSVHDQAPDVSQIEVPEDFVTSLVEGRDDALVAEEPLVRTPKVEPIQENELHTLLNEVKTLLEEVKVQLTETTTCGSLGTNQGGATTKETPEEDPMEKILKQVRKKRRARK
jgi:hypothetical protein